MSYDAESRPSASPPAASPPPGSPAPEPPYYREAPVMFTLSVLAVALYAAVRYASGGLPLDAALARWGWGFTPYFWRGQVWRLFVNTLHHGSPLHLIFNLLWLFILGRVFERELGSWRTLGFVILAAGLSGVACEVTFESGAIGLSGLLYALFGYMFVRRKQAPAFGELLTPSIQQALWAWLFICIALTYFNLWPIANVGHFSGLAVGLGSGWVDLQAAKRRWLLPVGAVVGVLALGLGLLYVWRPTLNPAWRAWRATAAAGTTAMGDADG